MHILTQAIWERENDSLMHNKQGACDKKGGESLQCSCLYSTKHRSSNTKILEHKINMSNKRPKINRLLRLQPGNGVELFPVENDKWEVRKKKKVSKRKSNQVTCPTDLSLIEPDGIDNSFYRTVQVGGVEYDDRRFTAKLQWQFLTRTGSQPTQRLSNLQSRQSHPAKWQIGK